MMRIIRIVAAMLSLLFFSSTLIADSELQDHPSPYLSMHANDPVDWRLWGKEILRQAKEENKLIFLSIGYFSCHWCHVMQRESYSDKNVGKYLNENYIPVKVDRELRPELDRRMISFVEAVRGRAGWPLNVFITPDGYPITGFTYLPKQDFKNVIQRLNAQWVEKHVEYSSIAKSFFLQTERQSVSAEVVPFAETDIDSLVKAYVGQAMMIADELQGGFGDTTKFPSYPQLNALMKAVTLMPDLDVDITKFIQLTLDTMASRHLMDHINNGFYRYSTDPEWDIPHFEKMLYDNAQLASLYLDADEIWPDRGYAQIGQRTIEFMVSDLGSSDGGFNASLSAVDTSNIEGGAYLWSSKELKTLLTEEQFQYLKHVWDISGDDRSDIQSGPLNGIGADIKKKSINQAILNKLLGVKKATMPVDDKKLASWNALVLKALVKAQKLSGDLIDKKRADDQYSYILKNFLDTDFKSNYQINRFAGQAGSAETTLEDYAHLAHALQLYSIQNNHSPAKLIAIQLVEEAFRRFYQSGYWVQNRESLIPGDKGSILIQDAVLESPLTILLETVLLLEEASPELKAKAKRLMKIWTKDVLDIPYYYGSGIMLSKQYSEHN